MGGNNVKGLYLMETIYPSENGKSVVLSDPKLQAQYEKEVQKGKIKPEDPNAEQFLDDDMDEKIDRAIKEVWNHYDPKGTGFLPKKVIKQFFSDSLDLYALRLGRKGAKEVIAPGVNYGQAMEESIAKVTNGETATFKQFEDFLNCYDIDEALGSFIGVREVQVQNKVQFVDTNQFSQQAQQVKKPVYRDYSVLQND